MSEFNKEIGRKLAGESRGLPGLGIVVIVARNISAGGAPFAIIVVHTDRKCGNSTSEKV